MKSKDIAVICVINILNLPAIYININYNTKASFLNILTNVLLKVVANNFNANIPSKNTTVKREDVKYATSISLESPSSLCGTIF